MHRGGIIVNIKTASKYQINDYKKSIKIYYLVIMLIIVFFTVLDKVWGNEGNGSYNGFETSAIIFLFICGLNSFKGTFFMMLQNGVSRKSMFIGNSLSILTVGMVMAVLDRVISVSANLISKVIGGLAYVGFYDLAYSNRSAELNSIVFQLEAILITCIIYTTATVVGYFVTILYYRMNTALKVIVSIGVPASILFIIPLIDSMIFDGKIIAFTGKFFSFIFGGPEGNPNPYNILLVCVIGIIIVQGLTWLLVRKAVDKN